MFYDRVRKVERELVPTPTQALTYPLEVTHLDFYFFMRPVLLKENSYNYMIISFGTNMENIELAEKLQHKLREWEVRSPVKIFVKVRDAKTAKSFGGDVENILFFGANDDCVYNTKHFAGKNRADGAAQTSSLHCRRRSQTIGSSRFRRFE